MSDHASLGPVLLVLPPAVAQGRSGNEVSAQRLITGLSEAGIAVHVARAGEALVDVVERIGEDAPRLVHAFHARRAGPSGAELARHFGCPFVVTLTGTDMNVDPHRSERRDTLTATVVQAAGFLCGDPGSCATIREFSRPEAPVLLLSKGVAAPSEAVPPTPATPAGLRILHPAHVRPVKNQRLSLALLRRLRTASVPATLTLLGDVLDDDYAAALAQEFPESWERSHVPSVPHDEMAQRYAAAEVVLLPSDSEGGSNAVLEAMAIGRTVVASDVPANRAYLGRDGTRGLVYPAHTDDQGRVTHDLDVLTDIVIDLARNPDRRRHIGLAAHAWVSAHHRTDQELRTTLGLYRTLVG